MIIFMAIMLAFIYGCSKDGKDPNPTGPTAPDEIWTCIIDSIYGSGTWNFTRQLDSSIVADGQWNYSYEEGGTIETIICPFAAAAVTLIDSSLSFTATSTAYLQSDPAIKSAYVLVVMGYLQNGIGAGSYNIAYTGPGWVEVTSGFWTATRTFGSGLSP
jgi:hypothetical protein